MGRSRFCWHLQAPRKRALGAALKFTQLVLYRNPYEQQSTHILYDLRQTLLVCQADEVAHRDEAAAARGPTRPGAVLRAWCAAVGAGSSAAVSLIRHI